ncbi:acetyl-CoA carboxylase biotin carboxyl carrier protein subunit [Bacteroidales bacterium]|nr:acetyl-CoA carboxylase biotin carboxyl carrier protein subunit [Bacteroidales bacterium]
MKSFKYTINGNVYKVVVNSIQDTIAEVEVNGTPYKVEMNRPTKKQVVTIKRPVQTIAAPPIARPAAGISGLQSPLPGTILEINCKVGDAVKRGQKLIVLEAMKMENAINSDRDGVIKEIKVNKGDSVLEGADLVIIE